MDRIKAYARRAPHGRGVVIDTEQMIVDLVMVYKASGYTAKDLEDAIRETWPQVEVTVDTSKVKRDS